MARDSELSPGPGSDPTPWSGFVASQHPAAAAECSRSRLRGAGCSSWGSSIQSISCVQPRVVELLHQCPYLLATGIFHRQGLPNHVLKPKTGSTLKKPRLSLTCLCLRAAIRSCSRARSTYVRSCVCNVNICSCARSTYVRSCVCNFNISSCARSTKRHVCSRARGGVKVSCLTCKCSSGLIWLRPMCCTCF